ncbi:uncharacterized protein KY384_002097 [Bacidia gigantensis]|uniref:uncharacterized protein n=1 Tax=Bacidia gigantensis TaxID=2732470 RepID=UPI001D058DFE|nr:uncharacterized protein KY384_002097 [Bacidia gigantensis]KAG8533314.1 hypothetical protein KY384_002097 [Bacidia gigantensis]
MARIQSSTSPPLPLQSSFPQDPADFDVDSRISFDKLNQKFILEIEDDKGQPLEFEYDDGIKRWIPVVDDNLLEQQRAAYAVQGVDESEPVQAGRKRKKAEYTNGEEEVGGRPSKKAAPTKPAAERKNTAVYITNLPEDTDVEEIQRIFSRCGVIAEEIDGHKPRIKLYTDDQGSFKGDALVLYFRSESVSLAVQMLDDTQLRLGDGPKMKVAAADFSYKQQKEAPAQNNKGFTKEKRKIIKKTQKLNNKLADWDDDDPQTLQETSSRWDKVVILKHMFTLAELEEDPAAILDIKEDIRSECSKLGPLTNVVIFDREVDGVATVRFSNEESAEACVRQMDGRHYSGMVIEARIADGSEKFKKTKEKMSLDDEDGDDEGKRLDQFGEWLEGSKGEATVDNGGSS